MEAEETKEIAQETNESGKTMNSLMARESDTRRSPTTSTENTNNSKMAGKNPGDKGTQQLDVVDENEMESDTKPRKKPPKRKPANPQRAKGKIEGVNKDAHTTESIPKKRPLVTKVTHVEIVNVEKKSGETTSEATIHGSAEPLEEGGDDRVTTDNSHEPLVPIPQPGSESPPKTQRPAKALGNTSAGNDEGTIPTSDGTAATAVDSHRATDEKGTSPESASPISNEIIQKSSRQDVSKDAKAKMDPPNSTGEPATIRPLNTKSSSSVVVENENPAPDVQSTAEGTASLVDEASVLEEATRKLRSPLVDAYSPYIISSDTSLKDARQRLRTALDQTRKLRAAFTERVYGKYRVCLKPPPPTDAILNRIASDPKRISSELQEEIRRVKEEKEIEKSEAQKLNSELSKAVDNATPLPSLNADNADQLMFISAGLSLVILPEDDVTGHIDMSGYPERAPTNPQTGQRIRGISAAAASAGEVILDRARKAAAMRMERRRRREIQIAAGEDPDESENNNYSRLAIVSASKKPAVTTLASNFQSNKAEASPATSSMVPIVPAPPISSFSTTTETAKALPIKPTTTLISPSTSSAKPAPPTTAKKRPLTPTKSPGVAASLAKNSAAVKQLRAKIQTNLSVQTLLSMHPSAEELREDGKACGATIALLERGVGSQGIHSGNKSPSHNQQQSRPKHPFPESLGARRRPFYTPGSHSRNKDGTFAPASHPPSNAYVHPSLVLPSLPSAKDRLNGKSRIKVLESDKACADRAKDAICCVLDQFADKKGKEVETCEKSPTEASRKRSITEISLLHGIQNTMYPESPKSIDNPQGAPLPTHMETLQSKSNKNPIDPVLAFNVLRAVGLIRASTSDEENKPFNTLLDPSLYQSVDTKTEGEDGWQPRQSLIRLKTLSKKFANEKRSFSQAFLDSANQRRVARRMEAQSTSGQLDQHIPKTEAETTDSSVLTSGRSETLNTEMAANTICQESVQISKEACKESLDVDATGAAKKDSPPLVEIRGGGEVLRGGNTKKQSQKQKAGQQDLKLSEPDSVDAGRDPPPGQGEQQIGTRSQNQRMPEVALPGQPEKVNGADITQHRMLWENPSRQSLVLLNPRLPNESSFAMSATPHQSPIIPHGVNTPSSIPGNHRQGQPHASEHYQYHSAPNALQLAHHLRHATASLNRLPPHGHHPAGDLADYIGGLHHQTPAPGGYDWSSIGAASAAALAAHSSLAALGISQHRAAAMANFQDRAARVLLAREHQAAAHAAAHRQTLSSQQAVAFLGGAPGHGYPPSAGPHFPHVTGHSAASTAALLNPSAAMMGHSAMQAPVATPSTVPTARISQPIPDQRSSPGNRKDSNTKKGQHIAKNQEQNPKSDASQEESSESKEESGTQKSTSDTEEEMAEANEAPGTSIKTDRPNTKKRQRPDVDPMAEKKVLVSGTDDKVDKPVARSKNNVSGAEAPVGNHIVATNHAENCAMQEPKAERCGATKSGAQARGAQSPAQSTGDNDGRTGKTPEVIIPSPSTDNEKAKTDASNSPMSDTSGMQFFVPPAPQTITAEIAGLVLEAKSHEAIFLAQSTDSNQSGAAVVEYLLSVGTAVPIPKALVANPLKDRLSPLGTKPSANNGVSSLPREVIVASILLWLWKHHEECFQRAFTRSGRIDVDPECKWLINAAVDSTFRALTRDSAKAASKGNNPLSAALTTYRSRMQKGTEAEKAAALKKLEVATTSVVSKALMAGLSIDEKMDTAIPHMEYLIDYLDNCRVCSLQSKSQERALLASLISRRATMSLPFSHAYVSSMVRAGEAIGHGELFEIVQNEDVHVSTMIPYDVFTDESGAWEDPCKPPEGFTSKLTGDDLMRRAHARAMMQKSLKKLQDRHGIRGGTPTSGPYNDPANSFSGGGSDTGSKSSTGSNASGTPRGWFKQRRSSFSEPPVPPGTGSAEATSWSLYDPRHYSAPLLWRADDIENSPYGRYNKNARPRSMSLSHAALRQMNNPEKARVKRAMSFVSSDSTVSESSSTAETVPCSTREIPWEFVAAMFESVPLAGVKQAPKETKSETSAPGTKTIFAPYVHKLESIPDPSDEESEGEEDLTDESVLSRHHVVLERMKAKLSAILEARKKHQDRRRSSISKK